MDSTSANQIVCTLYQNWHSSLLAYVCREVGSRADAEEIVQEAFLLLYRRCCRGEAIENPQGWTLRVARRLVWKRRTSEERGWPAAGDLAERIPALEPDPERRLLDSRLTLDGYLSQLTAREAEVVLLRLNGLRYREIAAALKIGSSSVNTLLARALAKMRKAVQQEAAGDSATRSYRFSNPQL